MVNMQEAEQEGAGQEERVTREDPQNRGEPLAPKSPPRLKNIGHELQRREETNGRIWAPGRGSDREQDTDWILVEPSRDGRPGPEAHVQSGSHPKTQGKKSGAVQPYEPDDPTVCPHPRYKTGDGENEEIICWEYQGPQKTKSEWNEGSMCSENPTIQDLGLSTLKGERRPRALLQKQESPPGTNR